MARDPVGPVVALTFPAAKARKVRFAPPTALSSKPSRKKKFLGAA
jgi:hypothetical protein